MDNPFRLEWVNILSLAWPQQANSVWAMNSVSWCRRHDLNDNRAPWTQNLLRVPWLAENCLCPLWQSHMRPCVAHVRKHPRWGVLLDVLQVILLFDEHSTRWTLRCQRPRSNIHRTIRSTLTTIVCQRHTQTQVGSLRVLPHGGFLSGGFGTNLSIASQITNVQVGIKRKYAHTSFLLASICLNRHASFS